MENSQLYRQFNYLNENSSELLTELLKYIESQDEVIGLIEGWPEDTKRYFDWNAWSCDLIFDCTVVPSPDDNVFVFYQN